TAPVYPITSSRLADVINRPGVLQDVSDFQGGAAIVVENITPPVPVAQIVNRLSTMRNKADFSSTLARNVEVRPLAGTEEAASAVVVLVSDPGVSFFESPDAWNDQIASREWDLVTEALTQTSTEISVQSFSAAVASTFRAQAAVAVGLSFLLIMIYIWVRFGSARYSMAAIVTLLHDVLIAIGLIALAEIMYEHDWTQSLARAVGVQPFKIDLTLVAAILTIIGYSLNDTIIIMDRIRENRGKLDYATDQVIEDSINQTISRTVITSGTTLVATLILYLFGGEGIRAFSYALLIGIVIGTYSSIAVAAPWVRARGKRFQKLESGD
ncbi:MAG: protein translocase subunit SecF, partial [Phycisphaerales bacterium]|nr:protein translocase subunit SecF [Phycisphaerales bacterium]